MTENRKCKERETEYVGEEEKVPDFDTQTTAQFEILRFIKEKMSEALQTIDDASGGIRVESVDLLSLISEGDYAVSLELARMYRLGLEIVYTVEEIL